MSASWLLVALAPAAWMGGSLTLAPRPALRTRGPVAGLFDAFPGKNNEKTAVEEEKQDAEQKRLRAEKLRLQAEIADLQAEELSLKAKAIAPPLSTSTLDPPAMPPPAVEAPVPEVGDSLAELCIVVGRDAAGAGIENTEPLQRSLASAWVAARSMQQEEIRTLKRRLEAAIQLEKAAPATSERSWEETLAAQNLRLEEADRMQRQALKIDELWRLADRPISASETEGRARARALTRACFKFFSGLTTYDQEEEEQGDDGKVPVPGEGLVSVSASRQRIRLLERHEAANCVEYRLFTSALSNDDAFQSAAGTELLLDEDDANANVTSVLTKWFDGVFGQDNEQFNEILGNDLKDMEKDMNLGERPLSRWLEPLAGLLGRSTDITLSPGDILELEQVAERTTLFPLLLLALCARQGNMEPLAVYYIGRILGRFNTQALAKFEGRDLAMSPDLAVSKVEAGFVRKSQNEFFETIVGAIILSYSVTFAFGAFILWNVVNGIYGAFAPPPVDPLAF